MLQFVEINTDVIEFRRNISINALTNEWRDFFELMILPYSEIIKFDFVVRHNHMNGEIIEPIRKDRGQIELVINWIDLSQELEFFSDGLSGRVNFSNRNILIFSTRIESILQSDILSRLRTEEETARFNFNKAKS